MREGFGSDPGTVGDDEYGRRHRRVEYVSALIQPRQHRAAAARQDETTPLDALPGGLAGLQRRRSGAPCALRTRRRDRRRPHKGPTVVRRTFEAQFSSDCHISGVGTVE